MHPHNIKASGSAAADDALVCTAMNVSRANEHLIYVEAGTVDVEVTIDEGLTWTDSGTFPVSVMKLNTTNPSTWALDISAGELAVLIGCFDGVRLRQKGATAASAKISSSFRYNY